MSGRVDPVGFEARGGAWLEALQLDAPIAERAVAVVAHPDDETLGLGLRLGCFRDLTLVHVTDGAPDSLEDREVYAAARLSELDAALQALAVAPRRVWLGLRDQSAVLHLPLLVEALSARLAGAALVITHAYEGGHPDHDAAACAVQLACAGLRRIGRPAPMRLEFAGYHQSPSGRATSVFWPADGRPAVSPKVRTDRLAVKCAALACYRSQAEVIAWFDPAREAYRAAPDYDFTRPPPPGAALYDDFRWPLTSGLWRAQARPALKIERETAA